VWVRDRSAEYKLARVEQLSPEVDVLGDRKCIEECSSTATSQGATLSVLK
jgi:hypothetical protein